MGVDSLIRWTTRAKPLIMARWAIDADLLKTTPHPSMIKKGRERCRLSDWFLGSGQGTERNSVGALEGETIDWQGYRRPPERTSREIGSVARPWTSSSSGRSQDVPSAISASTA